MKCQKRKKEEKRNLLLNVSTVSGVLLVHVHNISVGFKYLVHHVHRKYPQGYFKNKIQYLNLDFIFKNYSK